MSPFTALPDLALDRWGGAAVLANDEFFAPKENLVKAAPPVWREGEYTDVGKWMDGWETRRSRVSSHDHDWCIVRLGLPGIVRGVVVDTSFFTGNYPEACRIEGAAVSGTPNASSLVAVAWKEILPRTPLSGNIANVFGVSNRDRWTHLRLSIFPDGGVARLRVHGDVVPAWDELLRPGGWVDLAALAHGGRVIDQSDAHYGNPQNMLQPGRSTHMGDGWETRRRRGPGNDWAVVRLARPGIVRRVEIDTDHYKGNAPGACSLEGSDGGETAILSRSAAWSPLLPQTPVEPHARHIFEELLSSGGVTHVRINTYPDGGIARLRLLGTVSGVPS
ncbi:MAG: allantoicase [Gemmatimonadaceae bacterium]